MSKVLDFILAEPWCIQPEALEQIRMIAQRAGEDPEALATKLGRPLQNTQGVEMRGDGVAVIPIHGPIFRYANLFTEISGAVSLEILARDFATALDNPQVERIVLDVDSPGGMVAGISEFSAVINRSDKPVVTYVGDMCASASYWIGAAADEVVCSATALLGSIGIVATYRAEKDAPIKTISSQSPLKQATPDTPAGLVEAQRVVDELTAVFIADIARYRGVSSDDVTNNFGRGGVLVGAKSVAAGMADKLGSLESVIAGNAGESVEAFNMSKDTTGEALSVESLRLSHSDIYRSVLAEGAADAVAEAAPDLRAEGAKAERERIQGVLAQSLPGHEELVKALAFDGVTTAEMAAVQILSAEKSALATAKANMKAETPAPVPSGSSADGGGEKEKDTFDTLLASHIAAGDTRAVAMRKVVTDRPDLHREWLDRINRQKTA